MNQDHYEKMLDDMQEVLHCYCKELSFEIGERKDGKMELIISANGNEDYFYAVKKLVKNAPRYKNWSITAFKPQMKRNFALENQGVRISTDKIYFDPLESPNRPKELGLMVYIDGYDEDKKDAFMNTLCIALQTIVGEKVFGNDIKYIEIKKLPIDYEKYISIEQLPEFIKWNKWKRFKLLRKLMVWERFKFNMFNYN